MEEEVTSGCNEIQETLGPGTQGSQQGIKNVTKIYGDYVKCEWYCNVDRRQVKDM